MWINRQIHIKIMNNLILHIHQLFHYMYIQQEYLNILIYIYLSLLSIEKFLNRKSHLLLINHIFQYNKSQMEYHLILDHLIILKQHNKFHYLYQYIQDKQKFNLKMLIYNNQPHLYNYYNQQYHIDFIHLLIEYY